MARMQSFAKVRARAGESLLGADDPDGGDGGFPGNRIADGSGV